MDTNHTPMGFSSKGSFELEPMVFYGGVLLFVFGEVKDKHL